MSFFIFFRTLLRSILNSQADPPTLKNLDFASAGARFLKNQHFRSKHGFESALWLSWAPFAGSWGFFGASGEASCWRLLGDFLGGSAKLEAVVLGALKGIWDHLWGILGALSSKKSSRAANQLPKIPPRRPQEAQWPPRAL